jgi:hypothetical protein
VYSSLNIIRVIKIMRWAWPWAKSDARRALLSKPEEKRPLGRPTFRWEDIKRDLREIGWRGEGGHRVDSSGLG